MAGADDRTAVSAALDPRPGTRPDSLAPRIAQAPRLVADAVIFRLRGAWRVLLPATTRAGDTVLFFLDVGSTHSPVGWDRTFLTPLGDERALPPSQVDRVVASLQIPSATLLGTDVLSHFDLVFDGPARRVHLYAQPDPELEPARPPGDTLLTYPLTWLPPGLTPADCTPLGADPAEADRVFFPTLQVNGHVIHSMFDSGSPNTNMNLTAATVAGITQHTPGLQRVVGAGQFRMLLNQKVWDVPGQTLTLGKQRLAPALLRIYEHLPRDQGADVPEVSVGLGALLDRTLFVSYSTGHVCLGAAR